MPDSPYGPPALPAEVLGLRPRRHPDLAWRNWDGEVVILAPSGHDPAAPPELQDGAEHDLNPVGSRIFELCDGGRTVAEVAALLVEEFEVDLPTAAADAAAFVAEMLQRRLLTLEPAATAPAKGQTP